MDYRINLKTINQDQKSRRFWVFGFSVAFLKSKIYSPYGEPKSIICSKGFTIVELLVVIVVIGILAAITLISYTGISSRAVIASVKSDISQAYKQLEISKTISSTDAYPINLATANLKSSNGTDYNYYSDSPYKSYCLTATNGTTVYSVSGINPTPILGNCLVNGLVGYWTFNGNAIDSSGNDNNGVISGTVLTTGQNGMSNGAYSFNGIDNIISVNHNENLNPANVSVSIWVKRTGYNASICSILRRSSSDVYSFMCGQNSDIVNFKTRNVASWYYTPNIVLSLNIWTHLVGVFDGTTIAIYKNGVMGSSNTAASPLDYTGVNSALIIGRDDAVAGRYLNGILDDVRIYNRPLSINEISALFSAGAQ